MSQTWVGRITSSRQPTYTHLMPPLLAFTLPAFLLGLLLGSFLNVLISRLPARQSVVTPRSHCPYCGHTIRWYDNIPLLSFVLLRARCRDCHQPIPWRYPAVELLTAVFLALLTLRFAPLLLSPNLATRDLILLSILALATALLGLFLLPLLVIDWQHHLLPDVLTLTGMATGFFLVCTQAIFLGPNDDQLLLHRRVDITAAGAGRNQGNVFLTGPEHLVFGRLLAIVAAALLLLAVRWIYQALRHREGMGLGDAKLLAMIAAFLGFSPALLALFAGVLAASVFAVILLARRRAHAATRLPFGSFLAAGGLFAALFGPAVLNWYKSLL